MDDLILGNWAVMLLWGMLGKCEHADTVRVRMVPDEFGEFERLEVEAVWADGSTATGYATERDKLIEWKAVAG